MRRAAAATAIVEKEMHGDVVCRRCGRLVRRRHGSRCLAHVFCHGCGLSKLSRLESRITSLRRASQRSRRLRSLYLRRSQFLASWNPSSPDDFMPPLPDVSLQPLDGPSVAAHGAILAGKSRAFKTIFCESNSLAQPGQSPLVIQVDDVPYAVLKAFIKFFYTATIDSETLEKHSFALYCAAEKYGVTFLKKLCEEWIVRNVNEQNAISSLKLAHQYCLDSLKDAVFHVASMNMEKIPSYPEYPTYVEREPHLLIELYEGSIKKLSQKGNRNGNLRIDNYYALKTFFFRR